MALELTRDEIIKLMVELDHSHWLSGRLHNELRNMENDSSVETPQATVQRTRPVSIPPVTARKHNEPKAATVSDSFGQCKYTFYGNGCRDKASSSIGYCDKHTKKCGEAGCNNQITHGCPIELQFVCGNGLCGEHYTCSYHNRL